MTSVPSWKVTPAMTFGNWFFLAGGPRRDLDCRYGLDHLGRPQSAPTVKQHLAAIRMMFDGLATGGILPRITRAPLRLVGASTDAAARCES